MTGSCPAEAYAMTLRFGSTRPKKTVANDSFCSKLLFSRYSLSSERRARSGAKPWLENARSPYLMSAA